MTRAENTCVCSPIGRGAQTFRIREPDKVFRVIQVLSPDYQLYINARAVWACDACGTYFAWLRIPFKDLEEIVVRSESTDWQNWQWNKLVKIAEECRWQGPVDAPFVD